LPSHSGIFTVIERAARKAAPRLRRDFNEVQHLQVSRKGPADFVSMADKRAEETLVEELRKARPDWSILAEEGGEIAGDPSKPRFIIDPLDGTTNFLHGFPQYAVSIAAQVDGDLTASVVLNVPSGELFSATKGGGARLNGQPIAVSTITDPTRALIATGFPFKGGEHVDEYLRMLPRIMRETSGIRRPGAASLDLAYVACGRFEAFWEIALAPWDIAAGILLIREAGGIVTDLTGAPIQVAHTGMVTGNPAMHAWLLDAVLSSRA
jgi:myo-inositol-1(or 4)-monophosphatase